MNTEDITLDLVAKEICRQNEFNLISLVGKGGFKHTFHIKTKNDEDFALKIFHPEASLRDQREIDSMLRCDHPTIAKIYHVDKITFRNITYRYLVEEFLGGGTLFRTIEIGKILNRDEILFLGEQLIDGISHIASLNLVHRDIKPQNILYRKDSNIPVITDFGIVRDLDADSITTSWLPYGPGTKGFAPPEQLLNQKQLIDWRADQYSLGITISILGLNFHPYEDGDNTIIRMMEHKEPNIDFIKMVKQKNLPTLIKMINPWPANRYRTPQELKIAWENQKREK